MTGEAVDVLRTYWGHSDFRGSQQEIIAAVMDGRDVLALMPTAAGKSICYQLPAVMKEGICVVVSPLIALMQDQVSGLKKRGIKAAALISGLSQAELVQQLDNCIFGKYKFLYLSPERLQQSLVQERLADMPVNLWAVDEAHCISQWGHDFRPAYLKCSVLRELHPEVGIIALTATATARVAQDIVSELGLLQPQTFRDSFQRPNLAFKVIADEHKLGRLLSLCELVEHSGIVYTRTRRDTVKLASYLNRNGISASYYHGGLAKEDKMDRLSTWLRNKCRFMVATNAFGMGVDKADVQLVVHFQIPDCLENYFQEAGRAGRDGRDAKAVLIVGPDDKKKAEEQFLDAFPDTGFLKLLYRKLNNYFQISYGEKVETPLRFNFNGFCDTYKLPSAKVYHGLKILDQHSVLSLSQNFQRQTTLRFTGEKETLISYLSKNKDLAAIVQNILRTYGGVFDFETRINTALVARKSNVPESTVLQVLDRLHKAAIIDYQAGHTDLEISFLVPREDEATINTFASGIKALRQLRSDKLLAMFRYIYHKQGCRLKLLLAYFGEKLHEKCGRCDLCLQRAWRKQHPPETLRKGILGVLTDQPLSSRQMIRQLPFDENEMLGGIQSLLEDGLIEVNSKNQYQICVRED